MLTLHQRLTFHLLIIHKYLPIHILLNIRSNLQLLNYFNKILPCYITPPTIRILQLHQFHPNRYTLSTYNYNYLASLYYPIAIKQLAFLNIAFILFLPCFSPSILLHNYTAVLYYFFLNIQVTIFNIIGYFIYSFMCLNFY